MYFIPDLTGENPAYKENNAVKRVVVPNQQVELFTPVYMDTLEVVMTGTVTTPLVRDIDWTITESDYDYDAIGRAQLLDKNFDKKLVKSFTILKPFADPY